MMDTARLKFGKMALVVGRAGMDLYPSPDGARIHSAKQFVTDVGGSAGNIAVALARQGCNAGLMTAFSDDGVGQFVLSQLKGYGVDTRYCYQAKGLERTSLALAETTTDCPSVVIYRNDAADLAITLADAAAIDLDEVGCVILTGTALSREPSRSAAQCLIERSKGAGVPTILDLDYRAQAWVNAAEASKITANIAQTVDMVLGNDAEFDLLNKDAGREYAQSLACGDRLVLYKMGEAGCDIITATGSEHIGIFPVTALKPFGAGDAFVGGIVATLAQGGSIIEASRRGAATAALVVSRLGCASAMPDKAALDAFMAKYN